MATAPDEAVVARLTTMVSGTTTLTSGTNLFSGRIRPEGSGVPMQAVFCLGTGGPVNQPYIGGTTDWRVKRVQVAVRGSALKLKEAQTLARDCITRLHRSSLAGYTYCFTDPAPLYESQESDGSHVFTFNVTLGLEE